MDILSNYDTALSYPGVVTGSAEFIEKFPHYEYARPLQDLPMNRETELANWKTPRSFSGSTTGPVYLGEFGVIQGVEEVGRDAWISDVLDFCRRHGIGYGAMEL